MATATGSYVTLANAKLRLLDAGVADTSNDGLIAHLCDEVNQFIEGRTGRVVAPVPAFSSTLTGSAGSRQATVAAASGLAVGDDILIGLLSGAHESASVMSIAANLSQAAGAWAAATPYLTGAVVQPTAANGHTYLCVVAGTSNATTQPTWPTTGIGVADGTAVWLDLGLTSATVWLDAPLASDRAAAPCQRVYVQDGHDALDGGRRIVVARGLIMLAALEVAPYTGGAWGLASQSDYFLRPSGPDLEPGWPFTEVVWTDVPTGSTYPTFYPGYGNIRLIGPGPCVDPLMPSAPFAGWPAVPDDLRGIAEALFLAAFRARASSGGDSLSVNLDGTRVYERALSYEDKRVLERYRAKTALAV